MRSFHSSESIESIGLYVEPAQNNLHVLAEKAEGNFVPTGVFLLDSRVREIATYSYPTMYLTAERFDVMR